MDDLEPIRVEVALLVQQLRRLDPTDEAYPKLYQRLLFLESLYPMFIQYDSPSQKRDERGGTHVPPFRTLETVHNPDRLTRWGTSVSDCLGHTTLYYLVTPQPEGVPLRLEYTHSRLTLATLSTGTSSGVEVTTEVRSIPCIPQVLPETISGTVTIEATLTLSRDSVPTGSSVSEAVYTLLRSESRDTVTWHCLPYSVDVPLRGYTLERLSEDYERLTHWGCLTRPEYRVVDGVQAARQAASECYAQSSSLPYPVTAATLTLDYYRQRYALSQLPSVLCYQPSRTQADTTVTALEHATATDGTVTTVLRLDPVEAGGVTVARLTLTPTETVQRRVGLGSRVTVERTGPQPVLLTVRSPPSTPYTPPRHCPSCRSPLEVKETVRYCTAGLRCPAQQLARYQRYCAPDAANLPRYTPSQLTQLLQRQALHDYADLYTLEEYAPSRTLTTDRLLYALHLDTLTLTECRTLASHYPTLESLLQATPEDLRQKGYDHPTADRLYRALQAPALRTSLDRLLQVIECLPYTPT